MLWNDSHTFFFFCVCVCVCVWGGGGGGGVIPWYNEITPGMLYHVEKLLLHTMWSGPVFYLPPSLLKLSKLWDRDLIFIILSKFIFYLLFG